MVPAGILLALYSGAGMTAAEVGRLLGISHNVVLRSAHSFGLAVRVGGAVPPSGPEEIELIAALYSDGLVDAALRKHKILRVRAGGPVWERFPEPVPLSRQLVGDLYWGCGVGLNHIELVTGQPAMTVRGFMRRAGMLLRHPGGRSPFMRRWRTGLAADRQPSAPGWPEPVRPVRDGAGVGVGGVDVAAAWAGRPPAAVVPETTDSGTRPQRHRRSPGGPARAVAGAGEKRGHQPQTAGGRRQDSWPVHR